MGIIGFWKTTPCKVAELILDASVFPVSTRTPSTGGTEALRIERGASVVIAHLRMLSNTHLGENPNLNQERSPIAKQHPKELKREPASPTPPLFPERPSQSRRRTGMIRMDLLEFCTGRSMPL